MCGMLWASPPMRWPVLTLFSFCVNTHVQYVCLHAYAPGSLIKLLVLALVCVRAYICSCVRMQELVLMTMALKVLTLEPMHTHACICVSVCVHRIHVHTCMNPMCKHVSAYTRHSCVCIFYKPMYVHIYTYMLASCVLIYSCIQFLINNLTCASEHATYNVHVLRYTSQPSFSMVYNSISYIPRLISWHAYACAGTDTSTTQCAVKLTAMTIYFILLIGTIAGANSTGGASVSAVSRSM